MPNLSKGDRVSWKAGRGTRSGEVVRVITGSATVGGRKVSGSKDDPRYVVKDADSGSTVVRKGASLTPRRTARKLPAMPRLPSPRKLRRPRRPSLRRPGRRTIAIAVAVLAFAGLVFAYYTYVPDRLADDYEEQSSEAFTEVDEALYETAESFRARYFRGLAIKELNEKRLDDDIGEVRRLFRREYASERRTLDRAVKAADAAEQAIEDNEEDLTEVDSWPLVGGVGDLDDAEELADRQEEYLADAREMLGQYRELIAFARKMVAIEQKVTNSVLDEDPGAGASIDEIRDSLAGTLEGLREAKTDLADAGKAPEVAEPFEYATREGLELTTGYFRKLHTAFVEIDLALFNEANDEVDRLFRRFGIQVLLRFGDLQTDSELSDAIVDLQDMEADLAEELGIQEGPESEVPSLIPNDKEDTEQQA